MSAALVGHLEQSFFPSFTFINFTWNSSPSLHSSIMLENVMNQNESVQSEKGSWAKFYAQDRTSGRRTGLSTDFDSNTSAESFIPVGHKAGVKIDKKNSCLFFLPSISPPLLFPVTALWRDFFSQIYFAKLFSAWPQAMAGDSSWWPYFIILCMCIFGNYCDAGRLWLRKQDF